MTKIEIKQVGHDQAWYDNGEWRGLAGRLVLRWHAEGADFFLVDGTDDPAAALKREVKDAECPDIESTVWGDTVYAYRVRTPEQLAEMGYDDEQIAEAYADSWPGDDILEEVASDGCDWNPSEPECRKSPYHRKRKKHKWVSGQAYGHGGGVQYTDTCKRCGLKRHTDTWATDMTDGSQGHTSISYEDREGETLLRPAVQC